MPSPPARILIAEDEPSIRSSMSLVLKELGYRVRSAEDGFSALREIREEVPDVLISDLNMPGMSGFELLSVVRRRFPTIQSIAMSGAFSGDEMPAGVAAHAFYQKGSSTGALLRIIRDLPRIEQHAPQSPSALAPVEIDRDGHASSPEGYTTIVCPECLRTFSQPIDGSGLAGETSCAHCGISIQYGMLQPLHPTNPHASQNESNVAIPAQNVTGLSN